MNKWFLLICFAIFSYITAFSQNDYGFSGGTKLYFSRINYDGISQAPFPAISVGGFVKRNIMADMISLELETNYAFLIKAGKVKAKDEMPFSLMLANHLNNKIFATCFHNLSIPATVRYNTYKIKPFLGIEPYAIIASSDPDKNDEFDAVIMFGIGAVAGFDWRFSPWLYGRLSYTHGLVSDYNVEAFSDNGVIETWGIKNSFINISLRYYWSKKFR